MDTDKSIVFNPCESVFIGGLYPFSSLINVFLDALPAEGTRCKKVFITLAQY